MKAKWRDVWVTCVFLCPRHHVLFVPNTHACTHTLGHTVSLSLSLFVSFPPFPPPSLPVRSSSSSFLLIVFMCLRGSFLYTALLFPTLWSWYLSIYLLFLSSKQSLRCHLWNSLYCLWTMECAVLSVSYYNAWAIYTFALLHKILVCLSK